MTYYAAGRQINKQKAPPIDGAFEKLNTGFPLSRERQALLIHTLQEILVGLGRRHLAEQEFHRVDLIERL